MIPLKVAPIKKKPLTRTEIARLLIDTHLRVTQIYFRYRELADMERENYYKELNKLGIKDITYV